MFFLSCKRMIGGISFAVDWIVSCLCKKIPLVCAHLRNFGFGSFKLISKLTAGLFEFSSLILQHDLCQNENRRLLTSYLHYNSLLSHFRLCHAVSLRVTLCPTFSSPFLVCKSSGILSAVDGDVITSSVLLLPLPLFAPRHSPPNLFSVMS